MTFLPLSSEAFDAPDQHGRDPDRISKRIVLHFPGFEPLDAKLHHDRYARAAAQSATTWGLGLDVGPLCPSGATSFFDITCRSGEERVETRFHVFDHNDLVAARNGRPLLQRVLSGYNSAAQVIITGAMTGYFRHAWRFGLFFLFPFLLVLLACLLTLAIAGLPLALGLGAVHCLWSLPLAAGFFRFGFMPVAARLHTLHLFADWDLAVAMSKLDRADVETWLTARVAEARAALSQPADEYVITSHSMGSTMATHVIGRLLEEDPGIFDGKRVAFVTLGGAVLQCALLRPATVLRQRVGRIARTAEIFWLEIQCLTDSVHFYRSSVVSLTGHADAPQASIAFMRVRRMLSQARYKRIKRDFLRVHRQYVLGSEKQSNFDFTLMTAGPLAASRFADFAPQDLHGSAG